jgi:hypothetical protein
MKARVTILHDVLAEPADPEMDSVRDPDTFDAQVLALEQPWMELNAHRQVARGAAVRIDKSDAVWLGEVEGCTASGDDFRIRVHLRHVLRDFETLARLAERFGTSAAKGIPVQI